jgi:glycosyltransferase involved in cell wall biosynthesis
VIRKCYRGEVAASGVLAGTLTLHRGLKTYRTKVSRYIALNDFCRKKFIEGGLPAERIVIKPNFVDSPPLDTPLNRQGLLFVGRLSVEKGVHTLARAAALLPHACLRVVGEGPEAGVFDGLGNTIRLGSLPHTAVRREMSGTVALVVPSICYETFGLVIVEAFASGTPVLASRIGVLTDLVREGETGICFEPGDSKDLADKMAWILAHPEQMAQMGRNARAQYEAQFSADENYRLLMKIYADAQEERKKTG